MGAGDLLSSDDSVGKSDEVTERDDPVLSFRLLEFLE